MNFDFLKSKAFSKFKNLSVSSPKVEDNYGSHFDIILELLSSNVRKSKDVLVLYTEVSYLRSVLLTESGFILKPYRSLMLNYLSVLDSLKSIIPSLNGNLSKDLFERLVEFFYYLSLDISNYAEKSNVKSSVLSSDSFSNFNSLDSELNKVRLVKNRIERENHLSQWFLDGKVSDLKNLNLSQSAEEILSELKNLRDGKYFNSSAVDLDKNDSK